MTCAPSTTSGSWSSSSPMHGPGSHHHPIRRRPSHGRRSKREPQRARTLFSFAFSSLLAVHLLACAASPSPTSSGTTAFSSANDAPGQLSLTFEEYVGQGDQDWFLTGKLPHTVSAMMPSRETSFHNDLEACDYTVANDWSR